MGMRMHSNKEGVCGNNAVQFQFCDNSSYCTVLRENNCTPANSEIPVWSDDGTDNSLKAESMCTMKTIVANRPWWCQNWWKVCGKQFCRTCASQFRNSLINFPDASLTASWNHLPVAEKNVSTTVTSWLQTLVIDSYDTGIQTLVHWYDKSLINDGDYVEK